MWQHAAGGAGPYGEGGPTLLPDLPLHLPSHQEGQWPVLQSGLQGAWFRALGTKFLDPSTYPLIRKASRRGLGLGLWVLESGLQGASFQGYGLVFRV